MRNFVNNPLIELSGDQIADGNLLKLLTQPLYVVLVKVDLLSKLQNHLLVKHRVVSLESIPERAFRERSFSDLELSSHLTRVYQRFLPVDRSAISLLNNVEALRSGSDFFCTGQRGGLVIF